MPKWVLTRRAADNRYLHRDFHGALSCALEYLESRYGSDSVPEYLERFVRRYYAPLRREIRAAGLAAIAAHFRRVYAVEECPVRIRESADTVVIETPWSPAVRHIRARGYPLAGTFVETLRSVNAALCAGTAIRAELTAYDPDSGASICRFTLRRQEDEQ